MTNLTLSINQSVLRKARKAAIDRDTSVTALILAAAERADCKTLWSEGFSAGQTSGLVSVHNPFAT